MNQFVIAGSSMAMFACALLMFSFSAQATILWSQPGTTLVCNTGEGVDILHGVIKPQDSNSTSTLYFRFRVDPIADSATKSIADFAAGFVFFEKGEEHLGLGSSRVAWAYCAMNVTNTVKGYVDLNSATPAPGFTWEYIRAGVPKYIAFKIQFVPGHDAQVTAWLAPDLSIRATEINQSTNLVTRFETKATFDEIHLIHNGGKIGWKFSQMVAATSFEDLRLSHFWQSSWFIALTGGGLLAMTVGVVQLFERRRVHRKIMELERERAVATERSRIARDIHDELGASLTKIHKLSEMLEQQNDPEGRVNMLSQTISLTARHTIQTMDEIVWAVNPENDTLKEMADYLVFFTESFLRHSGVSCLLDVPLNLTNTQVAAEIRHNIFMVVKEALNNAVKHADAREIRFELLHIGNMLEIKIIDNGRGFHQGQTLVTGNGLENMRKRMSALGGELNIQSEPGKGTKVRLKVLLQTDNLNRK